MRAADFAFFDAPFLAFAHRGGADYGPNVGRENTLAAFRAAVDLGYRYLETDVHATRDGVLVAFHDDALDRVSDQRGHLAELPWAQVRAARVGGEDAIPTLAALLEEFPSARLNIDIKAPGAVEPLVRTINEYRAHDRVCVASFSAARLHAFRRLMGAQVPTAVSARAVAVTALATPLALLLSSPGVALQLPTHHEVAGRRIELVTPRLISAAHARGKEVHVWTVDDAAEMVRLLDLGVDGIFTDRPDTLKAVLEPRGLWS